MASTPHSPDHELKVTGFLPPDEQVFFDSVVHGLRSRGWSKLDAEGEALERLERSRAKACGEQQ
jgi:hypothetical protein